MQPISFSGNIYKIGKSLSGAFRFIFLYLIDIIYIYDINFINFDIHVYFRLYSFMMIRKPIVAYKKTANRCL